MDGKVYHMWINHETLLWLRISVIYELIRIYGFEFQKNHSIQLRISDLMKGKEETCEIVDIALSERSKNKKEAKIR